ncbi:diguanylate cyclase [Pleionea sp. CnH1-48]|uniref:diguanylate cyclase n=1 Tax=Pleionea sp. CnH1-48 TaxID=2954494 RepID=UPI002097E886|nr:diguanylate cyclase [Pleionea sp. CnH1-48]MCO7223256.1 diguanylate cyclase [Pleionea sp. CnH1-48]
MHNPLGNLKPRRRLFLIFLISLSGMFIILALFYYGLNTSLINEKKSQSNHLTTASIGVVKYYYRLFKEQKMTESDAKRKALDTIENMTFSGQGYYWINDGNGILLMHPYTSEYVGTDVRVLKDINGVYMFREFIREAKAGGGYVEYYWPKPNGEEKFPKLSYVGYFEPWDWVVGTGLYIDEMQQDIQSYANRAIGVVVFFAFLFFVATMYFMRKLVEELRSKAIRDPLTSLYTRRYLNERLSELQLKMKRESDARLAVLFMDIDHFKNINDTYGHNKGDAVIEKTGKVILSMSRPDDICVRYGGEEFVVIAVSEHTEVAELLAERIRLSLNGVQFDDNSESFNVTLSVGVAYQKENEELSDTIERADQNLYKAKEEGRDRVICDDGT